MGLPTGPDADRKLAYIRRAKRRSKRDLSEFLRQGITPLTPFDFGTNAAGPSASTNELTLPANGRFVLELDAIVIAGDFGITDGIVPIVSAEGGAANSKIEVRHVFRRDQGIRVVRAATCPAGALNVYFQELGGKLTLIGTGVYS